MSITAVLFAAGRGERLRPLSDLMAKPALPILDVPLAAFGLTRLVATLPTVVMNLRHLPQSVTGALTAYVPPGARLETILETPEAYGTGGTLAALRDRVAERVLTLNADLLTDLEPADLLDAHAASGAPATVAVTEVSTGADFVLEGDRAAGFLDRRTGGGGAGGRFLGMAVFEREVLYRLPESRPLGLGETLLADLARAGELAVYRHRGYARDVGTVADYLAASLDLLAGRGPKPPGGAWPGDVAEVGGGRAYLGPGASAGAEALGPGAILLAGSSAGPGCRIERSIVWPGEAVPAGRRLEGGIWAFRGALIPPSATNVTQKGSSG